MRRRTWAALTTAAGLALAPAAAQAATTITVTALGNDGAGSLRQAVTDAVDGDTIVLPEGTITLTGVLEILDKTLTIQGQGVAKSTITGNGTDRLLQLDDTVDADGDESDVITDVTLRGGRSTSTAGGAIGNAGGTTLTLRRVALLDNRAPIGGAADLAAPFHLEDVLAAGNVATGFDGGAFQVAFANGSTMDNVTITGNTAEGDGGAFDLSASASLTTLTITNSTIANNTIASDDNGAGFRAGSNNAVTLKNTVIAGNTEPSGVDNCAMGGGASITSTGNNATDQTAAADLCNLVGPGDLRGVASPLVAMSDLGGPFDTMYLLPSGALIDGATTCSLTDGRGLPRAATCDIGAVERTVPSSTTGATDSVTKDSAHLTGTANGNGLPGKAYFEYGATTAYGTSTAQVPVAAGAAAPVAATLTGLTPATSYHLRLVVQTTDGKVNGDDVTFTTLAAPDPGGGGGRRWRWRRWRRRRDHHSGADDHNARWRHDPAGRQDRADRHQARAEVGQAQGDRQGPRPRGQVRPLGARHLQGHHHRRRPHSEEARPGQGPHPRHGQYEERRGDDQARQVARDQARQAQEARPAPARRRGRRCRQRRHQDGGSQREALTLGGAELGRLQQTRPRKQPRRRLPGQHQRAGDGHVRAARDPAQGHRDVLGHRVQSRASSGASHRPARRPMIRPTSAP